MRRYICCLVMMLDAYVWFYLLSLFGTSQSLLRIKSALLNPVLYDENVPESNHIYYKNCAYDVTCDPNAIYRTINGSCNNLLHPLWGVTFSPFLRLLEGVYSDGDHEIRNQVDGTKLPGPRELQVALFLSRKRDVPDIYNYNLNQFLQWTTHDITTLPPNFAGPKKCCDIPIDDTVPPQCRAVIELPIDDPIYSKMGKTCMEFRRAMTATLNFNCTITPQIPMNQATPFIDSSQLYGPTQNVSDSLRTFKNGKLKTDIINGQEFCPLLNRNGSLVCIDRDNVNVCFNGGDARVNQHFGITLYHTIFTKFHNYISDQLQQLNPEWTDELIFQETRRFIYGINQKIFYQNVLSVLLGKKYLKKIGLFVSKYEGTTYNPSIMPQLTIEFAGSIFRMSHNILPTKYNFVDKNNKLTNSINLNQWMSISDPLVEDSNMENLLRGMTYTSGRMLKPNYNFMISNFMSQYSIPGYKDLLSTDIQRSRDTGVPPYNMIRVLCGYPKALTFEDLADTIPMNDIKKLKELYATVDDIDLIVGALLEPPCPDAMVGPTARCIIADVFYRIRFGDRYFYNVKNQPGSFSKNQLNVLNNVDLGHVFCAASGIDNIPSNIFQPLSQRSSNIRNCKKHLSKLDLSAWKQ